MSIKDFLRAPRMECELSPAAVAQEIAGETSPAAQWEIVNSARTDARRVKWLTTLATGLALYGAMALADGSKGVTAIFCGLAAVTACVANDHRRFQKAHTATLVAGSLQEITCRKINWHLYD